MPHSFERSASHADTSPQRTSETPFDSIESAQDFVQLLGQAIDEAIADTAELERAAAGERHLDALRLASYKLRQLREHVTTSGKLLKDLRTLRRLLLNERRAGSDTDAV